MTCFHPIKGWRSKYPSPSGKFPVVFKYDPRSCGEQTNVECGQCRGCRLEKSRVWASRCMHEAQILYELYGVFSSFITLTYDEDHLPYGGTLVKYQLQNFFKRLRWHTQCKIRYYAAGEYGSKCPDHETEDCFICGPIQRPHYHAVLLGFEFPDKEKLGHRDGETVYRSDLLEKCWQFGSHEIGSCTFESCAYTARYIMKKRTGKDAEEHYVRVLPDMTMVELEPEFAIMSTKPGLGNEWYQEYWKDLYPHDQCPIPGRGVFGTPPKYYDSLYALEHNDELEKIKEKRREAAIEAIENGPSLQSRERVCKAKTDKLVRKL